MIEHPDWKIAVLEDMGGIVRYRMVIYRKDGEQLEILNAWNQLGDPVTTTVPANESGPEALIIPESVANVIRRGLSPEKDRSGELEAVKEALTVERARVDQVLKAYAR